MKVNWSPLAISKLESISDYIALDKESAAINWVNDILDSTDSLANQPEMGRAVPELLGTNYRELIVGNYRVIYSIGSDIQILTIRNCKQILKFGVDE
ncbi:type II toxin-antitoxin system RelE/ParE family toxin [Psychrosphaera algicola]|uniref:Type II toxin-antitoxin system RelE/ParE family toxin n=1 Tax=Psychrosphaera algicola TaxID=3023714 RepID=A0ABT5FBP8_9GAMM|nr:type II toxin-antitoxin system RelE/ParE family toxin [Psychrosphaera sp. G1-22]MDC2888976.1 type II toxin-antitoxin system RelE/ParE family toxin [Psychrosphaera sp. G1-22]